MRPRQLMLIKEPEAHALAYYNLQKGGAARWTRPLPAGYRD
jgi:hypothetical protein